MRHTVWRFAANDVYAPLLNKIYGFQAIDDIFELCVNGFFSGTCTDIIYSPNSACHVAHPKYLSLQLHNM